MIVLQDALPYLWKVYKDVMPSLDGVCVFSGDFPAVRTSLVTLVKYGDIT